MDSVAIELDQLEAHPANTNTMGPDLFDKLKSHIQRTGRYPPLIVRPLPAKGHTPRYQILDGHHRVEALRQLGQQQAQCTVWAVDDGEALVLIATLNRLEGRDDPWKRSALIAQLRKDHDVADLARLLPERAKQLEALLALQRPPIAPRPPQSLENMPLAVHFFLLPEQRRRLEACLKEMGPSREGALMRLVEVQAQTDTNIKLIT